MAGRMILGRMFGANKGFSTAIPPNTFHERFFVVGGDSSLTASSRVLDAGASVQSRPLFGGVYDRAGQLLAKTQNNLSLLRFFRNRPLGRAVEESARPSLGIGGEIVSVGGAKSRSGMSVAGKGGNKGRVRESDEVPPLPFGEMDRAGNVQIAAPVLSDQPTNGSEQAGFSSALALNQIVTSFSGMSIEEQRAAIAYLIIDLIDDDIRIPFIIRLVEQNPNIAGVFLQSINTPPKLISEIYTILELISREIHILQYQPNVIVPYLRDAQAGDNRAITILAVVLDDINPELRQRVLSAFTIAAQLGNFLARLELANLQDPLLDTSENPIERARTGDEE